MYAILRNNQLITQGHDGEQFITDVDEPGIYQVQTCMTRGDVVEFGSGTVEVTEEDLSFTAVLEWLRITDYKVEILTLTEVKK